MKVSLLIPAFNCEDTLRGTVDSILRSGMQDFEIVLVDDGSTDRTPELCDALSREHPEIVSIHQNNTGVSGARNRGIQEAQGEYILFFDSDDAVDPGAFACLSEILNGSRYDMILFGMTFDYYRGGSCYRRERFSCHLDGAYQRDQWLPLAEHLFCSNYLSPVWNKLIRRKIVIDHRLMFSEEMHLMEDCLFSLQCLEHCETVYLLSDAIYHYRQPEDEGNASRRLKKVTSLVDYMEHFSSLDRKWDEIVNRIYFMLLRQKISASDTKEIAEIAGDCQRGSFVPKTENDKLLFRRLEAGNYRQLYLLNQKSRIRHRLAVFAKAHGWIRAGE